jgi:hypothetical protein
MKKWTHKVVKMSRGGQGEWFAHKAAKTFTSLDAACEYARSFHAEQQAALGVSDGHKYCVVARSKKDPRQKVFRLNTPASFYATELANA